MPPPRTTRTPRSPRPNTPRPSKPPRAAKPDRDDRVASPTAPARLQKVLARAGIGSRRNCEELITAGRVEVDGQTVTELGTKVSPGQEVRIDGQNLAQTPLVYYLVYKPTGVVSTNHDPAGRTRVIDLLPPTRERLFAVGRLDMSSEGLMLLTNDGELANRLAHPRYGVQKTYLAVVAGAPNQELLDTLRRGVYLAEGIARVEGARIKKTNARSTQLEIVLSEGKNREIRRILAKVGHKVLELKRIAIAGLRLGEMTPGEYRRLTPDEVRAVRNARYTATAKPRRSRAPRPDTAPTHAATREPVPIDTVLSKVAAQKAQSIEVESDEGTDESQRTAPPRARENKPSYPRSAPPRDAGYRGSRPAGGKPPGRRPAGGKPTGRTGERPAGGRPGGGRPAGGRPSGGRPTGGRPTGGRPAEGRPAGGRPAGRKPSGDRSVGGRPTGGRPAGGRPAGGRPGGPRPMVRKTDEVPAASEQVAYQRPAGEQRPAREVRQKRRFTPGATGEKFPAGMRVQRRPRPIKGKRR